MEWRRHIARYGDGWFPGEPWVRWTFILLLLLAGGLRFWNLAHLPFTHDELSALMRLYPTLGETIQRGVIELDTHPPGVQVLEWAWTRFFGTSEAMVKIPFILLALAGLFFHYRATLAWTSAGTALIMSALLATLQYTVLYAQIARPYAVGFFTVALLADSLTRYLAFGRRGALIVAGLAAVACAYTHHFTLLLAAIMVISTLGLVPRTWRRPYLLMGVAAAVAYLPNLPIFAKQLGHGGLGGWLSAPDAAWIPRYLAWILHFSLPLMVCVGSVVLLAVLMTLRQGARPGPASWLFALWALAPWVIGHAYSVWREPVLQYSVLLFSFPFLLGWLFMGLRHASRPFVVGAVVVLALLSAKTLIVDRRHYALFNDSPYAAMVRMAMEQVEQHGPDNTLVVFDAPRPQVEFHVRRHGLDERCTLHWPRTTDGTRTLARALADQRYDRVVLGATNGHWPERLAQVQAEFPYTMRLEDHVEGQVRVLTRSRGEQPIVDRTLLAELRGGHHQGFSSVVASLPMAHDPHSRTSTWIMDRTGFGLTSTYALPPHTYALGDLFEGEMEATQVPGPDTVALVLELRERDTTLVFRATPISNLGTLGHGVASVSLPPDRSRPDGLSLVMFAYDPKEQATTRIRHLRLYRRHGNPVVNGLFEPVHDLGHHPFQASGIAPEQ